MALEIAAVPILTGEASDRFDQMMEQSELRHGSVDFSREINEARAFSFSMSVTASTIFSVLRSKSVSSEASSQSIHSTAV